MFLLVCAACWPEFPASLTWRNCDTRVSSWPPCVGDLGLRAFLQGFPGVTSSPFISFFPAVTSTVKQALQEALVQILQPQRRVDVLRDVMDAQRHRRPYVVTFCGVNGVGKSTNLAKVGHGAGGSWDRAEFRLWPLTRLFRCRPQISFWLIENGFSVLIAACDTFRAGAVEQLRTHTRRLNALHPPESHGGRTMVQLYEKGYGKDAAGIAMEAISYGRKGLVAGEGRPGIPGLPPTYAFSPSPQLVTRASTWCWWTRRAACRTTPP